MAKDLITPDAECPPHRCLPDIVGAVPEGPSGHRFAAANDRLLAGKGFNRNPLTNRAAPGENNFFAIGASPHIKGIARLKPINTRLDFGQREFYRSAIGIATGR